MRAFLAIEVSSEIISRLLAIQRELPPGARPVGAGNMHVTLKFLGEISDNSADEISKLMDSLNFSPFQLECRGLGVFPSRKLPRVLWASIRSPGLMKLHNDLEPGLQGLGFRKEDFTPHITIARLRGQVPLGDLLARHGNELFGDCAIEEVHLKKSTLTPEGPVYEDIHVLR